MSKISDKFVEKMKTHFMLQNFFPKIVTFMWIHVVGPDRPPMAMK